MYCKNFGALSRLSYAYFIGPLGLNLNCLSTCFLTSSLPDRSGITAHTAEVLQLVERAQVPKGGWVGGDSWFGLCSFQQWKCISALEYTPVGLSSKTKAGFLKMHY
jgi:hypothetical protein